MPPNISPIVPAIMVAVVLLVIVPAVISNSLSSLGYSSEMVSQTLLDYMLAVSIFFVGTLAVYIKKNR